MVTITEDYVSFETVKLLNEKGFDCDTDKYYSPEGRELTCLDDRDAEELGYAKRPTLQLACKWLREVHGLHISLEPYYDYDSMHVVFLAFVQNVADVHEFMDGRKNVASYPNAEKCCELAIKYCLENLI
jgi:hypothetical protein